MYKEQEGSGKEQKQDLFHYIYLVGFSGELYTYFT